MFLSSVEEIFTGEIKLHNKAEARVGFFVEILFQVKAQFDRVRKFGPNYCSIRRQLGCGAKGLRMEVDHKKTERLHLNYLEQDRQRGLDISTRKV